jgi:hypothetical protein
MRCLRCRRDRREQRDVGILPPRQLNQHRRVRSGG